MRKEISYIIETLQSILYGQPWYGQPVMQILQDVRADVVYKRPAANSHSLIDLLYHMNTWAAFTLRRLEKDQEKDLASFEEIDWRQIQPGEHTWEKGVAEFKVTHDLILELLESKDDGFLLEKVDFREYNFRFLLYGIIQHDIYHIGQIAYLKKLLE